MYEYKATIRRVIDGDTVDMDVDLGFGTWRANERMRLAIINAPEMKGTERPAGIKSKQHLEALLPLGTEVVIRTEKDKSDSFGRWIAHIFTPTSYINDQMVADGMAVYKEY